MIYIVTNTTDNKRYIGKTSKTLEERWYKHCKSAEYGSNTYLHKAIRKYGSDSFKIEYLMEGLDEEEVMCIDQYTPEYNMTVGGDGGDTSNSPNYMISMERRNYEGRNNPNYGKKGEHSPNYGKRRTEDQKQNISNSDYLKLKKKKVKIYDVVYDSISAAARAHSRSARWVKLHGKFEST